MSSDVHVIDHGPHHEHNDMAHVAPASLLLKVFAALVLLTILTVWCSHAFHFGGGEVWIALGIATVKAILVGLYFMHLRYEKPFNTTIFLSAFLFVAVFLGYALIDTTDYQPDIVWKQMETPAAPAK